MYCTREPSIDCQENHLSSCLLAKKSCMDNVQTRLLDLSETPQNYAVLCISSAISQGNLKQKQPCPVEKFTLESFANFKRLWYVQTISEKVKTLDLPKQEGCNMHKKCAVIYEKRSPLYLRRSTTAAGCLHVNIAQRSDIPFQVLLHIMIQATSKSEHRKKRKQKKKKSQKLAFSKNLK